MEILGAPVLHLDVASDRPNAFVAATLSEVLPDGSATRLTYGILNLTHRDGHEDLKPLEPGKRYTVRIRMNECGQRIGSGNRLRLAISTAYWPIVWPSPELVTLTVAAGVSSLELPVRPPRSEDAGLRPFERGGKRASTSALAGAAGRGPHRDAKGPAYRQGRSRALPG